MASVFTVCRVVLAGRLESELARVVHGVLSDQKQRVWGMRMECTHMQ